MTQESDFIRLEETVQKLLKKYSMLKAAKEALEIRVRQKDQEVDELRMSIQNMQSERGDVSDRVSSLLDQIEQWEQEMEDEEAAAEAGGEVVEDDEDSAESRQGNLFSDAQGAVSGS